MASVDLTKVWLHATPDLSDFQQFWSDRPGDDRDRDVEVRTYASGRHRVIARSSRRQTTPITLVNVTDEQLDWLDALPNGAVLQYRDPRGRLLYGTFVSLGVSEYRDFNYEVSLTLQEVTYSIEV